MRVRRPFLTAIKRLEHADDPQQIDGPLTKDLVSDPVITDPSKPGLRHIHDGSVSDLAPPVNQ